MPVRKPSGAAVRNATTTTTFHSQAGAQPASEREPSTIARPIAQKSGVVHSARYQPGAVSLCQPRGGGGAGVRVRVMAVRRRNLGHFAPLDDWIRNCTSASS